MNEAQRVAINAVVGFFITVGLYLLFGEPLQLAVTFGVFAGIGFGLAVFLLGRFEERLGDDEAEDADET